MCNPQAVLFTREERPALPPLSPEVSIYKLDVDVPDATPLVRAETCKIYRIMGLFLREGINSPSHRFRELYNAVGSLPSTWFSTAKSSLSAFVRNFLDFRPTQSLLKEMGIYQSLDDIPSQDRAAYVLYLSLNDPNSIHNRFANHFLSVVRSLRAAVLGRDLPAVVSETELNLLRDTFNLLLKCESLEKVCLAMNANIPFLAVVKEHHTFNFKEELEFLGVPILHSASEVKNHFKAFVVETPIAERVASSLGITHISVVLRRVVADLKARNQDSPSKYADPYQEMFEDS